MLQSGCVSVGVASPRSGRKAGNCTEPGLHIKTLRRDALSNAILKPETHGQVFTPVWLVRDMLALRKNTGRTLEPSCGSGAFSNELHRAGTNLVAIELDRDHAPAYAQVGDFFDYPVTERFQTIVGNPPYVRNQCISGETKVKLDTALFDARSNLYLFFIEKCIRHLDAGGELIFVVPREFPQATSARKLNRWLFEQGSITDFWETGDSKVFSGATPPCCVFRFEKGRKDRTMSDGRVFAERNGQLFFLPAGRTAGVPLSVLFDVSVGGVTGANDVFIHEEGALDVVYSATEKTGKTQKMLNAEQARTLLLPHKARLLGRGVRKFTEDNWWEWGRYWKDSDAPRVYVNNFTRNASPFYTHESTIYDGSVLALFPKFPDLDPGMLAKVLNDVDWGALGFKAGGRFVFKQRALLDCMISCDVAALLMSARR